MGSASRTGAGRPCCGGIPTPTRALSGRFHIVAIEDHDHIVARILNVSTG
jgi:hypothetical protein